MMQGEPMTQLDTYGKLIARRNDKCVAVGRIQLQNLRHPLLDTLLILFNFIFLESTG